MTTDDARIAELEDRIAELTARLDAAVPTTAAAEQDEPRGSRRNMLKLAAGAAVGGTAAALAVGARPVAAADTDPVIVGDTTTQGDTGQTTTVIDYQRSDIPQVPNIIGGGTSNANVFTVRDREALALFNLSSSSFPAAIGGYGYEAMPNGVYGFTSSSAGGYGVVGLGSGTGNTGLLARGTRANVELTGAGDAPPARTDAHVTGEIVHDSAGDLWFCVADGTPGTWKKLSGPGTAGAFHAVSPFRAHDSRQPSGGGRYDGDSNRTVSIKDARNVSDGEVATADVIPAGATAIAANVAVIGPTTAGFMSVNPGGDAVVAASSVNYNANENTSNAGIFTLNANREVEVVFGPGGGGNVAIDVTGYWT